ncbi:MAG: hypothetical protein ACI8Y4_005248 [Candidatus Poriferisodalaceae bacterium]|jgi:hypothetical protein
MTPTPHRQTLDPINPKTRKTIGLSPPPASHHREVDPEPDLGIPPHPRRTHRSRPHPRSINHLEDPQTPRNRPCTTTFDGHIDPVPTIPSHRRLRLRHHRHQPDRALDHPSSPQPIPTPSQPVRRYPSARGGSVALVDQGARSTDPASALSQIASASSSKAAATRRWRCRASTPSS